VKPLLTWLVALFPRRFRREFGSEMRRQIAIDYDSAAARGRSAALWFSLTTTADVVASAFAERLSPTWIGRRHDNEGYGRMKMGEWLRDLRYAVRSLARAPGFTGITVGTLALAIGVNTGIFSVVDAVLLESLPFEDQDELIVIRGSAGPDLSYNLSDEFYLQFRESQLFESFAFVYQFTSSLRVGEETERAYMASPSTNVFETLGVEPILGRLPTPEDDRRAAMLSHAFWTTRYGADPEVLGRTVFASGSDLTIIGVMPPDFFLPAEGVTLWIPGEIDPASVTADVVVGGPIMLARLAPGVTPEQVETEVLTLARGIPERFGGSPAYVRQIEDFQPLVRPLAEELLGSVRAPLWILFAAVGLVLVIACANVASLFAVRAEDRLRESAVRRALGAGRARLIGSLFSEAVIVAGLAGVLAVVVARLGLPLISSAAPDDVPRLARAGISPSTLAFTALATALCALACGLVPALRSATPDLDRLRGGTRGATQPRRWGRDALVAGQTALALVLLIGSGLLLQSFWSLSRVDPGYDTEDLYTFQIAPASEELFDGPSYARFHLDFMERLRALPGVESVGIIENVPLNEGVSSGQYVAEERAGDPGAVTVLNYTMASGEVFGTMGIDLLEGRTFNSDDLELGAKNVLVSRAAADLVWPGGSPLGRRIVSQGTGTSYTVIGVVEDILQYDFRDKPLPMFYLPLVGPTATSWTLSSPGYVVRTERAETIEPEIRALVREAAPGAPMYRNYTMADLAADSMIALTFTTLMLGIVSTLALLLGAIGLYGILSYVVSRRRREIGVRIALGAQLRRVQRMVVAQGARVMLVGVLIGLGVAAGTTRVLEGLLFQVESADAGTYVAMSAALLAVGLLASWLPARRASSVDPIESLRSE
jgi:putative ABC transport system permease protein